MKWLLLCIPVGLGLAFLHADPVVVFLVSALAIIPLAQYLGDVTEDLASYLGSATGGLLIASMGTLPDLIIGIFALRHGLIDVVKASITGAIVGNILLGVGLAILLGTRRMKGGLKFDPDTTHFFGGLMLLAIMGLIIPAIFSFSTETEREISLEISIILLAVYGLSVLFTLTQVIVPQEDPEWKIESLQHPSKKEKASLKAAIGWLLVLAVLLSVMSEVLTEVLDPAASTMGFSATFTGIFLLAPIGGAAELINAVRFARKNQLDVALASSIGSSIQTALLAAPILVFAGLVMGQPMNLLFGQFQVVAIILAVVAINNTLSVGSVRWMAGIKLIAIYLMLGVGFYYQP